jgi:disulfide bond formation protein DsbB
MNTVSPAITAPDDTSVRVSELANLLALFGVSGGLLIAFYYQLALGELPCPLCLLQRVGMIAIGIGFMLNVRFGVRSPYYGIVLLGALLTGVVALRQMFLHIAPGDPGFGSTLFGVHFYTLSALTALATFIAVSFLLLLKGWERPPPDVAPMTVWSKLAMALFVLLIAANLLSTILECGAGQCDDNPTFYHLLGK